MPEISIKRGAALCLQLTFQDDAGAAIDLTNVTLTGQVRTAAGELVTALPIVRTDAEGIATVTVAATAQWPVGLLRSDIKAVINGLPILSETFAIRVNGAVTQ